MQEITKNHKSKLRSEVTVQKHKRSPVALGLSNLGNTCYANSVIQVLIHIREFYDILSNLNSKHTCPISPHCDFCSICYVAKILTDCFNSDETYLRAEEILDIIK